MAFSYVNATEIKTANMTMKFASDGKPESLTHHGKELLNVRDPGKGFEVSNEIGTGFVQEQTGRSKDANFLSAQNSALRGASSPV